MSKANQADEKTVAERLKELEIRVSVLERTRVVIVPQSPYGQPPNNSFSPPSHSHNGHLCYKNPCV